MGYGGGDGKLESGHYCSYRPARKQARRYTANDVARIYCHAIRQGVSRSDIAKAIDERCPSESKECTCEELMADLYNAMKVAELALAIIAIIVPVAKILRALLAAAKLGRVPKQLEDQAQKAAKQLEDQPLTSGRILEAEYERVIERQAETAAKIGAEVVVRP